MLLVVSPKVSFRVCENAVKYKRPSPAEAAPPTPRPKPTQRLILEPTCASMKTSPEGRGSLNDSDGRMVPPAILYNPAGSAVPPHGTEQTSAHLSCIICNRARGLFARSLTIGPATRAEKGGCSPGGGYKAGPGEGGGYAGGGGDAAGGYAGGGAPRTLGGACANAPEAARKGTNATTEAQARGRSVLMKTRYLDGHPTFNFFL
jgi:hypothetical protein